MKITIIFLVLIVAGILIASVPVPTPAPSPVATPTHQIYPPYEWCEFQSYNYRWICNWAYIPTIPKGSLLSVPRELHGKLVYSDGMPNSGVTMRLGTVFDCEDETKEDDCWFYISGGTSPATETDDNGRFVFEKIVPARYVILVHNLYDDIWWILVSDDTEQVVWSLYDISLDVGTIIFDD